jgi:hypothetical protein
MKNKPTLPALVKQVTKYLSGAGISASAVGDGYAFKGIKLNESDLGYLPAERWPQALLDTTPDLLRVAGLSETAARLNLHHVPFAPDEARIVCALLESPRPEKPEPDFASHLSAETDSPPNMTAAEESEQGAGPMPRARPRRPAHGMDREAPRRRSAQATRVLGEERNGRAESGQLVPRPSRSRRRSSV